MFKVEDIYFSEKKNKYNLKKMSLNITSLVKDHLFLLLELCFQELEVLDYIPNSKDFLIIIKSLFQTSKIIYKNIQLMKKKIEELIDYIIWSDLNLKKEKKFKMKMQKKELLLNTKLYLTLKLKRKIQNLIKKLMKWI